MARWAGTSPPVVETFMSLNAGSHLETGSVGCGAGRTGAYRATRAAIGNIRDHERWSKLEIIGVPPAWAMDAAREPAVRRARPLRPPAPVRRRSGSPPR